VDLGQLGEVEAKVRRCFEAGALATGATLEITPDHPPYAEMHHDRALAAAYRRNGEALGRGFVDAEGLERVAGSTDMGNVSLALPSIHPSISIDSLPAVNHQPEFTAHCAGPAADKAVLDGAVAMAWTGIDAAVDEGLRDRLMKPGGGSPGSGG
jgi:metal-dependent amidase/aminoacylase/carboxypeptidase family protein